MTASSTTLVTLASRTRDGRSGLPRIKDAVLHECSTSSLMRLTLVFGNWLLPPIFIGEGATIRDQSHKYQTE